MTISTVDAVPMDRMSLVPMRSQAPRTKTEVAAALREARDYTLSLYGHLDLDRATVPLRQEINPLRWELGHLGWFQEYWCLRGGVRGAASNPSRYADADRLWNSSEVPHDSRWSLPLPDARHLMEYLQATLEATVGRLEAGVDAEQRYFFELALYHEDMHGEAMLMTLQTLGLPAPAWLRRRVTPAVARSHAGGDVRIPAGTIALGSTGAEALQRFVFDNEKWAHDVELPAFAIARRCVTNEAFRAFVDDDGYRRPELWSRQGREFLAHAARDAPAYWRREGGEWRESRFDGSVPLDAEAPVQHVNAYEAEAWCRWAGRRLPTEAEWEAAALYAMCGTTADIHPNLDGIAGRPIAAHEGRAPLFHVLGNVWEWTASPFVPYPGFAPDPYEDYSAPWFDTHRVLRGGSWATRERLVHPRFRNFYMPQRHDPFVGFRTCAPHT